MVKPKLLKLALMVVEVTSIPLMVTTLIYLLTGYEMLTARFRLIPRARAVHTNELLRMVFATLVLLHGYAGLILLCERRLRNRTLKVVTELIITIGLLIVAVLIISYELAIRVR